VGKIAEKAVCRSVFTLSDCYFGDFSHWDHTAVVVLEEA